MGSKLQMSTSHYPQTDGLTEAMNRVVDMVLRCTIHESAEATHWEKFLSTVEFIMNHSVSQATGYTPFYLNYWL